MPGQRPNPTTHCLAVSNSAVLAAHCLHTELCCPAAGCERHSIAAQASTPTTGAASLGTAQDSHPTVTARLRCVLTTVEVDLNKREETCLRMSYQLCWPQAARLAAPRLPRARPDSLVHAQCAARSACWPRSVCKAAKSKQFVRTLEQRRGWRTADV
jgi:hypothetical protein